MKFAKGIPAILLLIIIGAAFSLGVESAFAQDIVWQNEWTVPQYLTLGYAGYATSSSNVAFSPDGEILIGAPSATQLDDQFLRVEGNGAVRWVDNIGGGEGSSYGVPMSLLANADGSAHVLANSGNSIVKINPDGSIAWARSAFSASALIAVSAQAVAVTDCNSISLLDANTGATIWRYAISQPTTNCPAPTATTDGSGNIYAVYTSYDSTSRTFDGYRGLELGANGNLVWDVLASAANVVKLFGAGSGLVYFTQAGSNGNGPTIVALDATSGTTTWTAPGSGVAVITASGDPIIQNAGQIQRLNAATGAPLWSQTLLATSLTPVAAGDILVGSGASPPELARLDAATGTVLWSTALPQTDSLGNQLGQVSIGEIAGPAVAAILKPTGPSYQTAPPILEKVDYASGQLLGQIPFPATAQGVIGNSVPAGMNGIAVAGVTSAPAGGQLRVRMLNASTGATLWETVDSSNPVSTSPTAIGVGAGGNIIAATVTNSAWSSTSPLGGAGSVVVDAFDSSTGNELWSQVLFNPSQGYTYSFNPLVDASGNVFVTYGAPAYCGNYPYQYLCAVQSLVKLAAANGSVAWQYNNEQNLGPFGASQVFPQTAVLQGSDVLLGGPFYGQNSAATLVRLSGADGSVQWNASLPSFAGNQVFDIFPGTNSIIAVGSGWAKIDATTGQVLWANSENNPTCVNPCNDYANLRLASDDILYGGENGAHATVRLLPASQGAQEEYFYLYQEGSILRSLINQIVQDSSGRVWLQINHYFRSDAAPGMWVLAQFDPSTGKLVSQQALAGHEFGALTDSIRPVIIAPPENNQVLVQTEPYQPGVPDTYGNALLNTAITANGDLALAATTDKPAAAVGQTLTFHFTVTYSGDAAISGAHMLASLPWPGMPTNVTCTTQAASNCVLDTRSETIHASFDMQPGGQVTVSGQIVMTSASGTPRLQGVVYGPTGLNEPNTTNNFGYYYLNDEIFANGFE